MDNNGSKLRLCASLPDFPWGRRPRPLQQAMASTSPGPSQLRQTCMHKKGSVPRPPTSRTGTETHSAVTRPLPRRELTECKPGKREAARGQRGVGLRGRKRALPRRLLSEDDEHGRGARARLRACVCSAPAGRQP